MRTICQLVILLLSVSNLLAQHAERTDGPVIKGYGSIWNIENPDLEILPDDKFMIVFDIYSQASDLERVNPSINTLARFLNMHVQAGVKLENISLVGVVHNNAGNDVMSNEHYQGKYGIDNPNLELIDKLSAVGVEFYICGQTMESRGLERKLLDENIKVSLSAMTAIVKFVNEGYTLIKF